MIFLQLTYKNIHTPITREGMTKKKAKIKVDRKMNLVLA